MNNETKKQLYLSLGLLFALVISIFMWYDNFMFHTYIKQVDFQHYFYGTNNDLLIDGYELCQDSQSAYYGNARVLSTNTGVFKKNDNVTFTVKLTDQNENVHTYKHTHKVKSNDEVIYLNKSDIDKMNHNTDIVHGEVNVAIKRNKKTVYNETVRLQIGEVVTYNGGNKDYKIQDVFVADKWLKTGYFSTTIENLEDLYEYCIIDYTYLKENGDKNNYDDYVRFALVSADTHSMLQNVKQEVYFYDDEGSLYDKQIFCFVTLKEKKSDTTGLTFMVDLSGVLKVGGNNG